MKGASVSFLLSLFVLSTFNVVATAATPKAVLVSQGFQTLLKATKNSLDIVETAYQTVKKSNDDAYILAKNDAINTNSAELKAATKLYSPQLDASNSRLKEARDKLLTRLQVRVLKLGTNRAYWGNLKCPPPVKGGTYPANFDPKSCNSLDDKGAKFNIGDETYLLDNTGENANHILNEIDIMINLGLIEMLNATEYNKYSAIIRAEPVTFKTLSASFTSAQELAYSKKDKAIKSAAYISYYAMEPITQDYEMRKTRLEAKIPAIVSAIAAAKKATRDSSVFDKAFVTALKFEYNRKWLNEIADSDWAGPWNFRRIDSLITATRLANQSEVIASNYRYSTANSLNNQCGDAFTSDGEFKAMFKIIASEYKKITKVTIKL